MDHVVDSVRGVPVAYALELCGDDEHVKYYYVGVSSDIQTRIAQHMGAISGGAMWTAKHVPTKVLDVIPCCSIFHACCVEVALWAFYAGKSRSYDTTRGGKYCMTTPLRYPPPGWSRPSDGFPLALSRPPSENDTP